MKIEIMSDNLHLSGAEKNDLRNRLRAVLRAKRSSIDSVQVWLCDLPSFASEAVIHCRIDVKMEDGRVVIGDSCASDVEVVVQRAISRVGRNLAYRIGRHQRPIEPIPAYDPVPPGGFRSNGRPVGGYLETSL